MVYGAGAVSALTYHTLHFGNNTAGRSGSHLLREVTRIQNVVHSRPMLTVVQQLVMLRILKRRKREEVGIETSSQKGFRPPTLLEH